MDSIKRFTGEFISKNYDTARPRPPLVLADIVKSFTLQPTPTPFDLVVDLGSGSGLSSLLWNGHAKTVFCVEPSPDMRSVLTKRLEDLNEKGITKFVVSDGLSTAISLGDGVVDVVAVAQAFHWFDPQPSIVEITRVLKPGGVLVVFDYDWPPTVNWKVDKIYCDFSKKENSLKIQNQHLYKGLGYYEKSDHLKRIEASNCFQYTKEITLHNIEECTSERLISMTLSQGGLNTLLKAGVDPGVEQYKKDITDVMKGQTLPMYLSYRVRIGVK